MATSMITPEQGRRAALEEAGVPEKQAIAIADTQTAVVNELALRFDRFESRLESRFDRLESRFDRLESKVDTRFTWTLVVLGLGLAVVGFLVAINGGDAAPTIHHIYTNPTPTATAIAEILPGR